MVNSTPRSTTPPPSYTAHDPASLSALTPVDLYSLIFPTLPRSSIEAMVSLPSTAHLFTVDRLMNAPHVKAARIKYDAAKLLVDAGEKAEAAGDAALEAKKKVDKSRRRLDVAIQEVDTELERKRTAGGQTLSEKVRTAIDVAKARERWRKADARFEAAKHKFEEMKDARDEAVKEMRDARAVYDRAAEESAKESAKFDEEWM
ncbi:hypothetical protein MNV49_007283 [Pseudohyphozyma bogoriensis]|nr:hypothetical protein MNV49_007283 [Pseudohyphozyma bogoriensis]